MYKIPALLLLTIFLSTGAFSAENGEIHLNCEPRVWIFLDGAIQGITREENGGIIIKNVSPGKHSIKAQKGGCLPYLAQIELKPGEILKYSITEFEPKVIIREVARKDDAFIGSRTGSIIIKTRPTRCVVTSPELDLKNSLKTKDCLIIENLPEGTYSFSFNALGKIVDQKVTFTAGRKIMLSVNILPGKITIDNVDAFLESKNPATYYNSIEMTLVRIPAGEFIMGSPESTGFRDEHPQRKVVITKPFYMGRFEVKQREYQKIMRENPSRFTHKNNPVEGISWGEAVKFCQLLSDREGLYYRLPTEAEWEYACRSNTESAYYFGDNGSALDYYGWYNSNSDTQPNPVGLKKSNDWGLFDMHGNVWEWCRDWYDREYYMDRPDPDYNPAGHVASEARVLRGGSWFYDASFCRSAVRGEYFPAIRSGNIGFRVVMLPE
jgi:formylglycine-generating enzyme required for sulfatase activity